MDYLVELSDFEGPLDLLLHLIKQSEVDICDINIEEITNQYLEYINKMEELNLNVASEYLVMAAELMEIKSYTLLPKRDNVTDDDYEEDPREQLINKLIEYDKYKSITLSLKKYEQERQQLHTKEPYDLSLIIPRSDEIDENININDLVNAMNNLFAKKQLSKPLNTKVTSKEYSVNERSVQIKSILSKKKKVEFTELFDIMTKDYIVVTFLSILNMARNGELYIKQDKNFDKIFLQEERSE